MKKFMMLFVGEDYPELGLSPEQIQERMGKWFAWNTKMREQGIIATGEALTYKIKRVVGPDRVVSDGPFVEPKEVVGGFYVIQAESFEHVVEIAQDYPDYDLGNSVEIREVMVFE